MSRTSPSPLAEWLRLPDWLDVSTWGASVGAHLAVLAILGLFHFRVDRAVTTLIDTAFEDSIDPDQYKFDSTAVDQVGGSGAVSDSSAPLAAQMAANAVVGKSAAESVINKVDETLHISIPTGPGILPLPTKSEMVTAVHTTGGSDHASGGVEGAIDRMAYEIANSLREKKTLVVWLFDVSPSLHEKREMIAGRVENIYRQLNELNVNADKALKSAVATFGEKPEPTFVTPEPVDDPEELVKAVRSIKSEDGGKENVFNAINRAATKWLSYRTKQNRAMMMIVITDEAGSDVNDKLEAAISTCKKYGIRCYAIGEEAPLGRKEVILRNYKLPNGDMIDEAVMDRGPEGYFSDRLKLAYWGSDGGGLDFIPSGFGPYGLTRLCAETNGLFLISDSEQRRFKIDPVVMKSYAPDYRPVGLLERDANSNVAKRALIEVCRKYEVERVPTPTLFFPAENDNVLRQAITEAQKPVAETEYRLDEMLRALEAGEKDRQKIQEPRWRAVYDLAMGRVLAMRARVYGYNAMLAEMKSNPKKFSTQGSNQWRLVPSKEVNSGAVSKKLVTKAQDYLKRVIDEHQGTPWATMAEREFNTPLGWEWKEGTYNPTPQNMAGNNKKTGPKFAEEIDPKTGKKVKKMIPDGPTRREI